MLHFQKTSRIRDKFMNVLQTFCSCRSCNQQLLVVPTKLMLNENLKCTTMPIKVKTQLWN